MKTKELNNHLKSSISKILEVKENSILIKIFENSSGVVFTLDEFFSQYNPEEIGKGQCNLVFRVDIEGKTIITFQLKDMYNCSGIIIGSDLYIADGFRHKGLGTLATEFMIDFTRYYGYGIIQGTDQTDNTHQIRIFEKLGWNKSLTFVNPKTKNELTIWLLNL